MRFGINKSDSGEIKKRERENRDGRERKGADLLATLVGHRSSKTKRNNRFLEEKVRIEVERAEMAEFQRNESARAGANVGREKEATAHRHEAQRY